MTEETKQLVGLKGYLEHAFTELGMSMNVRYNIDNHMSDFDLSLFVKNGTWQVESVKIDVPCFMGHLLLMVFG